MVGARERRGEQTGRAVLGSGRPEEVQVGGRRNTGPLGGDLPGHGTGFRRRGVRMDTDPF